MFGIEGYLACIRYLSPLNMLFFILGGNLSPTRYRFPDNAFDGNMLMLLLGENITCHIFPSPFNVINGNFLMLMLEGNLACIIFYPII